MKDDTRGEDDGAFESRSRALFRDSVVGMDFATRSRLTQARHAALAAAAVDANASLSFLGMPMWKPAAGIAAAAVLGVALWFGPLSGTLSGNPGITSDSQSQANLEDLDIVAASDPGSGDAMEMLQDDLDFYDFADKAAGTEPAA